MKLFAEISSPLITLLLVVASSAVEGRRDMYEAAIEELEEECTICSLSDGGITQNYKLTEDVDCNYENYGGGTIKVYNGATLDCDGYSIRGPGNDDYDPTIILYDGAILKNCKIENTQGVGIQIEGESVQIENVHVTNVNGRAVYGFSRIDGLILKNVAVTNNHSNGVELSDQSVVFMENVMFCNNAGTYDIFEDDSSHVNGVYSGTIACTNCNDLNYDDKVSCDVAMCY